MRMDATRTRGGQCAAGVCYKAHEETTTVIVDSGDMPVPLLFPWMPIARHPGRPVHPGRRLCLKGCPCPALRRPFGPGPGLPAPLSHARAPGPAPPWCCASQAVRQAKEKREMEWRCIAVCKGSDFDMYGVIVLIMSWWHTCCAAGFPPSSTGTGLLYKAKHSASANCTGLRQRGRPWRKSSFSTSSASSYTGKIMIRCAKMNDGRKINCHTSIWTQCFTKLTTFSRSPVSRARTIPLL
jgi:hypothetical protein